MEVRLPNLGEDTESGIVASIFVKEGDTVEKDQALIEIESEKAVASVPSTGAGKVTKVHVHEGDEIKVGALIATIQANGDDESESDSAGDPTSESTTGDEEEKVDGSEEGDQEESEDAGGGREGEIRLPNLGEDVESGTVASIFVKTGDTVEKDQALIEIESEKAVASVPSTMSGKVKKIHVREGEEIKVGTLIATIGADGEGGSGKSSSKEQPEAGRDGRKKSPSGKRPDEQSGLPEGARPAAPPSIRKIARDLGIDLSRVRPSARGGRIVLEDVRRYIVGLQEGSGESRAEAGTARAPAPPPIDFSRWGPIDVRKASSLRKTIASRMADSWTTIPHVMQFGDADVTELMALRKKHVPAYKDRDVKLTLTPILLKALAAVLGKHRLVNSSWDEANGNIVRKDYIHIGVAVDTDAGLLVPVIRDVDKKTVLELALELESLSEAARERKLEKAQMQGGTFTMSNQGGIGGAHFTPIINKPEAAILGIGRGREIVRMVEGKPEGRTMLPLTLSHDHRIIDGADGVRFLIDLIQAFEQFPEDDLEIGDSKG